MKMKAEKEADERFIGNPGEVEFVWNEKIYSITRDSEGKLGIMQIYKDETNQLFNSIDELLVYKLESGDILKDIITKVEISSRTL